MILKQQKNDIMKLSDCIDYKGHERFTFTVKYQIEQTKKLGFDTDRFEIHGAEQMIEIAKELYFRNKGIKNIKIFYGSTTIFDVPFIHNHQKNSEVTPLRFKKY